ncbi:MAG: TniB family protein [Rhodospirillaceae bacterium]|nr:MAG: TniB family protein [Rhodospirillaceae bacterium]
MMEQPEPKSRLSQEAERLLGEPDEVRIRAIRAGTWMTYDRAKEILAKMEDLLDYPRITRMPNMLLVAPSFNGKTSILERFMSLHPPDLDPTADVTTCPVVMVEAPPAPDVSAFYSRILDALMATYKPSASVQEKNSQVKHLFKELGVKILIVDEIHHLIAGSLNRQKDFRNALKSLGNESKVSIIASGIEDAYNAFVADPQMSSRFMPEELPLWKPGREVGTLLATLERRTPLCRPSDLKSPEKMSEMCLRSEGTLGDLCDLFKELAVDAIRNKTEEITLESIRAIRWVVVAHTVQALPR